MGLKKRTDPKSDRDRKNGSAARPDAISADEYGREGTNKTIAQPKADNAPSEELGNTPHVGKSPYTRG
ncbi:hypothetical protein [Polaromonas sp. P5_D5]